MSDLAKRDNSSDAASGLVEHLFRNESARLTALLTRIFGLSRIDLVENVVPETHPNTRILTIHDCTPFFIDRRALLPAERGSLYSTSYDNRG
jgi:hypothetical protein